MNFRKTDELNQDAYNILRGNQLLQKYAQLRRGAKRFLNKAIRINQKGEPYTIHDFPELTKSMWKKNNYWLRKYDLVETIAKSAFAYYRVIGFRLNNHWEKVTTNPTEVSINNMLGSKISPDIVHQFLLDYLGDLESPALHNIRFHFHHHFLYHYIEIDWKEGKLQNVKYDKFNKSFTILPPQIGKHDCNVTIIVTRKGTVQIMIKNTLKPLVCNEIGVYILITIMSEIKDYLSKYSQGIPPILDWIFKRADFGRDSKRPLNMLIPNMEFRDLAGALVRLYAKSWSKGERKLRLEKNFTPNKPMREMLEELLVV